MALREDLASQPDAISQHLAKVMSSFEPGGFTSLLLSLGALVGRLDRDTIYAALVAVPWKRVCHWVATNLGQTHQSKRRIAYHAPVTESATKST